eukprot:5667991-Prymnesium_polylepis.1
MESHGLITHGLSVSERHHLVLPNPLGPETHRHTHFSGGARVNESRGKRCSNRLMAPELSSRSVLTSDTERGRTCPATQAATRFGAAVTSRIICSVHSNSSGRTWVSAMGGE